MCGSCTRASTTGSCTRALYNSSLQGPAQGPCPTQNQMLLTLQLQGPSAGPLCRPFCRTCTHVYVYRHMDIYKYNYFTTACGRTQPVPPVVSLKHEKACGRLLCRRLLEPRGLNSVQHSSWHKLFGIFALANFEKDVCFIMLMRPVQGYQSAQPMEVPQCRM